MGAPEAGLRVLRFARAHLERWQAGGRPAAEPPAPQLEARFLPHGGRWVHPAARIDRARALAAADRIAEGWLDVFALRGLDLGSPPRWNRDPKTGIEAPLAFGKLLDCADAGLVGDIDYLWQPNRHQHLVALAQAWALTAQPKYFDAIVEHLDSWRLACPYPLGPNWARASEAAVRLANWAAAWQLLGGPHAAVLELHPDFRDRWLRAAYQHAEFVRGWLSRHTGGAELLVEAAGLYLAAHAWPHWPRARAWLSAARRVLERDLPREVGPDGVAHEHSAASQRLALEALLLCLLAARAGGARLSAACESRAAAMLDFLASTMDCAGNVPAFGDSDAVSVLGLEVRDLLAIGALLFRRGDFRRKAGPLGDAARRLLGPEADARYAALEAEGTRLPLRQQFPEGGYYVLGCDFDTPREIRIVADAGPLGARGAAKAHADALSFTLSAGGEALLVDPGTYAYRTHARWRTYFRGTSAHNTVRIDGEDQSVQAGGFVWLRKARAGCSLWLSSAHKDSWEAWHDGYMRLPDPVKHRRLVELDKRARRVLVEDTLEMEEEHHVELFFHFGETCRIEGEGGNFLVKGEKRGLKIQTPSHELGCARVFHGSVAPILGWVSPSFDSRRPAPALAWMARLAGRAVLRTEIAVLDADEAVEGD